MSVHVMGWIFRESEATLGPRLVLLALADNAHDDGSNAYPAVATLALKARLSERATQYALRKLQDDGQIQADGKHTSGTTIYTIVGPFNGGADSAPGGCNLRQGGVQSTTVRGADSAPEPSGTFRDNHQEVKSMDLAVAAEPSAVEAIFEHWRKARGKSSRMTLTRERADKIRARLKSFSPADLRRAIDGVAFDPWESRHLQDDLTQIFRTDTHVEKYLDLHERRPLPGRKMHPDDVRRETLRRAVAVRDRPPRDDVIDGELLAEEG